MHGSDNALVLSISDCPHYLVAKGNVDSFRLMLDSDGKPLRLGSLYAAKRWWQAQGATQVWLVNESPYDEMIGNAGPIRDAMELPLAPAADTTGAWRRAQL